MSDSVRENRPRRGLLVVVIGVAAVSYVGTQGGCGVDTDAPEETQDDGDEGASAAASELPGKSQSALQKKLPTMFRTNGAKVDAGVDAGAKDGGIIRIVVPQPVGNLMPPPVGPLYPEEF